MMLDTYFGGPVGNPFLLIPPQIVNPPEVFIVRGKFLANDQKTTRGPFSGGPRLQEPLREPLYINSLLNTYQKITKTSNINEISNS